MKEDQAQLPPSPPSTQTTLDIEVKSDGKKWVAALPSPFTPPEEKKEMISPEGTESIKEGQSQPLPPPLDTKPEEPIQAREPMKEDQAQLPPSPPSTQTTLDIEVKSDGKKRVAALPSPFTPPEEKKEAKLLDTTQSIEITSDQVETHWKENVILFKGNVIARQKDIVIYADSIEAVIIEDGKGIERVIAGGNVKIQQGLRVANCQKAIFYNVDQRVVLTGDPRVVEGDNLVSGEEIIFDMEKNRVEVKGGTSGRGKARIHPGKEIENLK
jgi:lipopolysaccharide export system protein LptA